MVNGVEDPASLYEVIVMQPILATWNMRSTRIKANKIHSIQARNTWTWKKANKWYEDAYA